MEVPQVGVSSPAPALTMATAIAASTASSRKEAKRRKVTECVNGDGELRFHSSCAQLSSGNRREFPAAMLTNGGRSITAGNRCSNSGSDIELESCCSSNRSNARLQVGLEFVDLKMGAEAETSAYSDFKSESSTLQLLRREATPTSKFRPESVEMESKFAKPSEENSRRNSTAGKMPSLSEIEEFFAAAEKGFHKRFIEKYNFDIVSDVPLEGRYEWVRLKP